MCMAASGDDRDAGPSQNAAAWPAVQRTPAQLLPGWCHIGSGPCEPKDLALLAASLGVEGGAVDLPEPRSHRVAGTTGGGTLSLFRTSTGVLGGGAAVAASGAAVGGRERRQPLRLIGSLSPAAPHLSAGSAQRFSYSVTAVGGGGGLEVPSPLAIDLRRAITPNSLFEDASEHVDELASPKRSSGGTQGALRKSRLVAPLVLPQSEDPSGGGPVIYLSTGSAAGPVVYLSTGSNGGSSSSSAMWPSMAEIGSLKGGPLSDRGPTPTFAASSALPAAAAPTSPTAKGIGAMKRTSWNVVPCSIAGIGRTMLAGPRAGGTAAAVAGGGVSTPRAGGPPAAGGGGGSAIGGGAQTVAAFMSATESLPLVVSARSETIDRSHFQPSGGEANAELDDGRSSWQGSDAGGPVSSGAGAGLASLGGGSSGSGGGPSGSIRPYRKKPSVVSRAGTATLVEAGQRTSHGSADASMDERSSIDTVDLANLWSRPESVASSAMTN
eukprot:CAMPEP_0203926994 /NCGR_PEP_ID=MMETSP0359-20131031/66471_1 /ASSEMBLY_ACC=CAM_ASM_000338 /TAXON_ID=268821 /ORGANISM="Scrippsiella Hangoei, Strain SHTV-5" /LENGTH=494 /DNA_ID=CAMNT_0050855689 /DNA_START=61 /DNA_END=1542 /DNA_ORIENTATION=+